MKKCLIAMISAAMLILSSSALVSSNVSNKATVNTQAKTVQDVPHKSTEGIDKCTTLLSLEHEELINNIIAIIKNYVLFRKGVVNILNDEKAADLVNNLIANKEASNTIGAEVIDPMGDDKGPNGKYQYPTENGFNKVMDLTGVRAEETADSMQITIKVANISDAWKPLNGFDHVCFSIFLDDPNKKGLTLLPKQNAMTPNKFNWDYEAFIEGWNKGLYTTDNASADSFGKQLEAVPDTVVDKVNKTIKVSIPKSAIGNPTNLKDWKVYVTTWDYDGISKSFRPLMKNALNFLFGGGEEDNAKEPYIMDDITPVTVIIGSLINTYTAAKKLKAEDIDFKIIDAHTHIGVTKDFSMTKQMLLDYMERDKIAMSVVSNIAGEEFGRDSKKIITDETNSQISINTDLLNFAKQNSDKIKCLFWIRPNDETFDSKAQDFMLQNTQYFKGFKFHPFHSQMQITDDRLKPYLEFANKYSLVFLIHTDSDDVNNLLSRPEYVYELAKKYTNVKFIIAHLGMGSDGMAAAKYISELPNLYGDIAQVTPDIALNVIKTCGSSKILYGTDSTIDDSVSIHQYFLDRIQKLKDNLSKDDFENVMFKNAEKIFK